MIDRVEIIDQNMIALLRDLEHQPLQGDGVATTLGPQAVDLLELFDSQSMSRHLDLMARKLRRQNRSFYTIGSSGHEGNAVVGRLTRPTDPALLHYRSGALMAERSRKVPGVDFVRDTLLSLCASREDPIAGGRHKVWGSRPLWVLPQTSTIASHLPKAVGLALAIARARRLRLELPIPADSIVLCSFGDASINHSSAQGAFNAISMAADQHLPLPLLLLCEDNGLGISVPSPTGWVARCLSNRAGLRYQSVDGVDIVHAFEATRQAVDFCRQQRRPILLHMQTVRLLGHAGSDVEVAYRPLEAIRHDESRDPLLHTARTIVARGICTATELLERYENQRLRIQQAADRTIDCPRLLSTAEVMAPLAPLHSDLVREEARRTVASQTSAPQQKRPDKGGLTLAAQINRALHELMQKYPQMVVFGEDVARKGGVYHVTAGLAQRFGPARVFNTLLDEQTILGLAQGLGTLDLLPFAEVQYLAYVYNAIDQLRGEACSLQYFSRDQFRNPMVVRIASFAYQKGFGGHFHNDNGIASLREIPALIVAAPCRGDDAMAMLRTCAALARVDGRVVAFLEPIALYNTRHLYQPDDGAWLTDSPAGDHCIMLGEGRVYHGEATDVALISYANGVHFSLRVARTLAQEHGIHARVIDLRWLSPLNVEFIVQQVKPCRAVVVVDEGRRTGGIAETIIAALVENLSPPPPVARVTGEDCYIPLGPAADWVLPTEERILAATIDLTKGCGN